jgi:hypothetical protein
VYWTFFSACCTTERFLFLFSSLFPQQSLKNPHESWSKNVQNSPHIISQHGEADLTCRLPQALKQQIALIERPFDGAKRMLHNLLPLCKLLSLTLLWSPWLWLHRTMSAFGSGMPIPPKGSNTIVDFCPLTSKHACPCHIISTNNSCLLSKCSET